MPALIAKLITTALQTGAESRGTADCSPVGWDCNPGATGFHAMTEKSRKVQPMMVRY